MLKLLCIVMYLSLYWVISLEWMGILPFFFRLEKRSEVSPFVGSGLAINEEILWDGMFYSHFRCIKVVLSILKSKFMVALAFIGEVHRRN